MIYQHAQIYAWVNSVNKFVYLGSSIAMKGRTALHNHLAKTSDAPLYVAMRELGRDKFTCRIIKAFPCESRKALECEEYRMLGELIAQGIPVYNQKLSANEPKSAKTKAAISAAKLNVATKCGCMRLTKNNWTFSWRENGKPIFRSFSTRKYGHDGAKKKVIELRQQIYPRWKPDPMEEAIDALMAIELD